jgi:hypothetical protein
MSYIVVQHQLQRWWVACCGMPYKCNSPVMLVIGSGMTPVNWLSLSALRMFDMQTLVNIQHNKRSEHLYHTIGSDFSSCRCNQVSTLSVGCQRGSCGMYIKDQSVTIDVLHHARELRHTSTRAWICCRATRISILSACYCSTNYPRYVSLSTHCYSAASPLRDPPCLPKTV